MRIILISILLAVSTYSHAQTLNSKRADAYQLFKNKVGKRFKIKIETKLVSGKPYSQTWKWRIDSLAVNVEEGDTLLCSVNLTCLSSKLKNHHIILMEAGDEDSVGLLEVMQEMKLLEIWADMPFTLIQSLE